MRAPLLLERRAQPLMPPFAPPAGEGTFPSDEEMGHLLAHLSARRAGSFFGTGPTCHYCLPLVPFCTLPPRGVVRLQRDALDIARISPLRCKVRPESCQVIDACNHPLACTDRAATATRAREYRCFPFVPLFAFPARHSVRAMRHVSRGEVCGTPLRSNVRVRLSQGFPGAHNMTAA